MKLPLKTNLFMQVYEAGEAGIWEQDAVEAMLNEGEVGDRDYWKNLGKFWLAEMVGNGIVHIAEQTEDETYYGRPATICRYIVTDLGKYRHDTIL